MNFHHITIIKKCFLCLLLLNSIIFFAMESENQTYNAINQQAEVIHNIIDQQFLGIKKNTLASCFEYSPFLNIDKNHSFLFKDQLDQKIKEIERLITQNTIPTNFTADENNEIFKKLASSHWYVGLLIKASIRKQIEEFKNITCSTIDQILNQNFINDDCYIKKTAHKQASAFLIDKLGLDYDLEHVPYQKSNDIHFTLLYGHTANIESKSMIMSKNGKYLKTTDIHNKTIVWETKNGRQTTLDKLTQEDNVWSLGDKPCYMHHCTIDATDTYAAININSSGISAGTNYESASLTDMKKSSLPIYINKNRPTIVLFMRPTLASYLCQELFEKNKKNSIQLNALKNSQSFKALEGFPRKNLERCINHYMQINTQDQSESKL